MSISRSSRRFELFGYSNPILLCQCIENADSLLQGIQQLKDQGYPARFIFLQLPDIPELSERLRQRGSDDEDKINARLEIAEKELAQAKVDGFHDKIIVNDDLQQSYDQLEKYIFGLEDEMVVEPPNENPEVVNEVEMSFAAPAGDTPEGKVNGELAPSAVADTPAEDKSSTVEAGESIK